MSDVNQFRALRVPTTYVGNTASSAGGGSYPVVPSPAANLKFITGGALTANTYKTLLSITGSGILRFAALQFTTDTQSAKMRITIDGVQLIEFVQQAASTLSNRFMPLVGSALAASADTTIQTFAVNMDNIPFNSSLLIEAQSSTATTNAVGLLTNYLTF